MDDDFSTQVLENVGEGIVERCHQNTRIALNIILYTDAMLIMTAFTYLITRIIISRIVYMLHNCYTLITLLIAILNRIPCISEASRLEGLIPMSGKHTLAILLFTDKL